MIFLVIGVLLAPWVLGFSVGALGYAAFCESPFRGFRVAVATTIANAALVLLTTPVWLSELLGHFPDGTPAGWAGARSTGNWEPLQIAIEEAFVLAACIAVGMWKRRASERARKRLRDDALA